MYDNKNMIISIDQELRTELLENAKIFHPKETFLILRGEKKKEKDKIILTLNDYLMPLAYRTENSVSYDPFLIHFDSKILGTAHSHPSGNVKPSLTDLNNMTGLFLIIMGFPYNHENVVGYDKKGNIIKIK